MFAGFPKLSAPIEVCGKRIRNQIVVPPMANFGLAKKDGFAGIGHQEYYGAYAEGGAGMIIVEASSVIPPRNTLELYDDYCIPGMTRLIDTIISRGAIPVGNFKNCWRTAGQERLIWWLRSRFPALPAIRSRPCRLSGNFGS